MKPMKLWLRWACLAAWCAASTTALAAPLLGEIDPDGREDEVPPPPAYSTSGLVDVDMPVGSTVKVGLDPNTLMLNQKTGIVRYVVVMRGTAAVNASYEGIRCATGEWRIYARQTEGNPWTDNEDDTWKPLSQRSGTIISYPVRLARDGLCMGSSLRFSAQEMVRELRTGNSSLYRGL